MNAFTKTFPARGVTARLADNLSARAVSRNADQFTGAAPFLFLLVAVKVLAFGLGAFSLDRVMVKNTEMKQGAA